MFLSLYKCTGTASQERRWREKKTIRRKNESKREERKKKEGSRMYQSSPHACSYIKPYRIHKTSQLIIGYKITVFYTPAINNLKTKLRK